MGCAASVELHNQLWGAVCSSDAAACRKTLSAGASPDVRNAQGETALHLGVRTFNSEVFRLLLEASVDREAKDAHGQARASPVVPLSISHLACEAPRPRAGAKRQPRPLCRCQSAYGMRWGRFPARRNASLVPTQKVPNKVLQAAHHHHH